MLFNLSARNYDFNSLVNLLFLIAHFGPDWVAQFAPESGAHFAPDWYAQFAPEWSAHFAPVLYAHFTPESGAQFDRIFQLDPVILIWIYHF